MATGMGLGVVRALASPAVVWPAASYDSAETSVQDLFRHLGLEPGNPLGRWIRPGMTVVIKPNWVKHAFGRTEGCHVLTTHTALLHVMIEAVLRALERQGRVYIADAPLQGCDFDRLRIQNQLADLERDYRRKSVRLVDLRQQGAEIDDASSYLHKVYTLAGDPHGYSAIHLGSRSRLTCFGVNAQFGVTDYRTPPGIDRAYPVSNTVLSADVILNIPKLKTHMKTGMTGALKNFIGIVGAKHFLPHFRPGPPSSGGDEYPDHNWLSHAASPIRAALQTHAPVWMWKLMRASAQTVSTSLIHGGGWYGNDTLWRTVHDLVDIARNFDAGGALRSQPRTILTLVDAIVAGEDSGPLKPRPKDSRVLIWGEDPGVVDVACATLMGFDWRKIPLLRHLLDPEARTFSRFSGETPRLSERVAPFEAPVGWSHEIELNPAEPL